MTDEAERTHSGAESNETDGTVRAQYDWVSTLPSIAVIETVAVAINRDPTAMESLYEAVNTDALDALIQSDGQSTSAGTMSISFGFADQQVTVHGSGDVLVHMNGSGR